MRLTIYTIRRQEASELNTSSKEARNCLWYDLRNDSQQIVYSVHHPNKDYKCREKELKSLRRQRSFLPAAMSEKSQQCRRLYLTATTSKTGNDGVKRRTPTRVLTVVENRTLINNGGVSLSLKPYDGDEAVNSPQGPFNSDTIPIVNVSASLSSSTNNKRQNRRAKKKSTTTTTTTTPVPEVATNNSNSNRRGMRRSDGATRRRRTIGAVTASGLTGLGGGGASTDKGDSVPSSRQTVSRSVAAVDAS